jgi:riboflavin kinase/FMN adenylyltransferase
VLIGLSDRLELLAATGLDAIVVWTFDADLAAHSPEQFLQRLHGDLRMRALLTGPNAHIGKDRAGTPAVIRVVCDRLGVTYRTVPWHGPPGATTSSALRDALRSGDLARVNAGLGRPYSLVGTVGRGDQRGRELGFPTANLDLPDWLLLPADGVYTAQALLHLDGRASECWRAAVSVGVRPTFGPGRRIVEAHLLDFDRDIYGLELRLFLRQWLRAERAFPDVDALVREMDRDVARARRLPRPDPADLLPFAIS